MSGACQIQEILCIDASDAAFQGLRDQAWAKSGILRWSRVSSQVVEPMIEAGRRACRILLFDAPERNMTAAWKYLGGTGLTGKVTIVSTIPATVRPRRTHENALPARVGADNVVASLPRQPERATVVWRGTDDATREAQQRFQHPDLQLVIEKYFPGWTGTASFDTVDGGRSGDSLVQVLLTEPGEEYYLKFFKNRASFVREWDGHQKALVSKWLDGYAVDLRPIPSLGGSGDEQVEAFPVSPAVSCFKAASVLTRLSTLYVDRDDRFVLQAYQLILEALARNQPRIPATVVLSTTRDIGPPGDGGPAASLLASLRRPGQRGKILGALADLTPYAVSGFVGNAVWQAVAGQVRALLSDWEPDALHDPCRALLGHVQGDANSRNFLFHGGDPVAARGLQVVDLGGYQPEALRVFDLAQLEADLKFLLMATETSCGGYLDLETSRLEQWRQEEERCIRESLRYPGPEADAPAEIRTAYAVVHRIREQAGTLSPEDPGGLAYLFCLLYWTLRKARLAGVAPRIKRMLAFYSAYLILEKLKTLRRP